MHLDIIATLIAILFIPYDDGNLLCIRDFRYYWFYVVVIHQTLSSLFQDPNDDDTKKLRITIDQKSNVHTRAGELGRISSYTHT